jgi:hypothetical protein
LGQVVFCWHLANPDLSVGQPDGEAWLLLQRMHFRCSRVQWRRALHHSSRRLVLHMVNLRLCAAVRPWKPISSSSWPTVIVLLEAVLNSVERHATEDRPFLHAMCFSTRRSRSVSLCGLPLHCCSVVSPRRFHFTITALTVDQGSSRRADIWRTDLLERWHPMTVSRWKSLSSSVRPFYCQCLSMEISWQCAQFYTPVSNECGWNSRIHSFECVSTSTIQKYLKANRTNETAPLCLCMCRPSIWCCLVQKSMTLLPPLALNARAANKHLASLDKRKV